MFRDQDSSPENSKSDYNFSITFTVIHDTQIDLRYTGKVDSVIILTYCDINKLSSVDLNKSTESTLTIQH